MGAVKASRADVARLWGRCAFGATPNDLDVQTNRNYTAIVDHLLLVDPATRPPMPDDAGENGASGTDHGNAAPLFLVGPPTSTLVGGVHGDHPDLGTTLLPADNLLMTTDLRPVYQAVLEHWLGNPDPGLGAPLPGLFTA